jgi:hypothetical protein
LLRCGIATRLRTGKSLWLASWFMHLQRKSASSSDIAPLFKADSATLSFYATKDGKITVSYQGWDQSKVVLDG